jgi:hypothetical protein
MVRLQRLSAASPVQPEVDSCYTPVK